MENDLFEREERCRKAMKTVSKAIFMRLFVAAVLIWAVLKADMEPLVIGLMALVMFLNLTGLFPLITEWKKCRRELKEIIAEDDA